MGSLGSNKLFGLLLFIVIPVGLLILPRTESPFYTGLFRDNDKMTDTISETWGFKLYFLFVSTMLLFSGLWIAASGELLQSINSCAIFAMFGIVLIGTIVLFWKQPSNGSSAEILFTITILYAGFANAVRIVFLYEIQVAFIGLTLTQGGSLGLLFAIFSRPMLPPKFSNETEGIANPAKRRKALNLHLTNQWRVGQIALTISVITVGGLLVWTFPQGGSEIAREKMAVTGLPLVATLGPVLLYVLRKLFLIEQEVVESFRKKD